MIEQLYYTKIGTRSTDVEALDMAKEIGSTTVAGVSRTYSNGRSREN